MSRTFILSNTNSDLTGGADWTKAVSESPTTGTITFSVAKSASENQYGITESNIPGANGATGNYTVEVNITTGSTDVYLSIRLDRVNSTGGLLQAGTASSEQQCTAGVKTFSFTSVSLGTWSATQRLRVLYIFRNANTINAQSIGIGAGTTDNEVVTPFTYPTINATLESQETGADVAAGSGTVKVSGTLATQEGGADVADMSGTVKVSGSFATQEAGADVADLSGTVEDAETEITGTLATQEAGADVAAASGTVAVSGSLATQEAGADVAAAAGAVAVSGALASQEPGQDVADAEGEVAISGTMATQEAGQDEATVSGSVGVSGTLASQEAGADVADAEGTVLTSGTLATQEAGNDVADASGSTAEFPTISGTIATVEPGKDVARLAGHILEITLTIRESVAPRRYEMYADERVLENETNGRKYSDDVKRTYSHSVANRVYDGVAS